MLYKSKAIHLISGGLGNNISRGTILNIINLINLRIRKPMTMITFRRHLSVNFVVSDLQFFFTHPKGNQNLDQQTDEGGGHNIQAHDESNSDELDPHLPHSVGGTAVIEGVGEAHVLFPVGDVVEEAAELGHGKYPGEDAAHSAGKSVGMQDGEGVVHVAEWAQLGMQDGERVPG